MLILAVEILPVGQGACLSRLGSTSAAACTFSQAAWPEGVTELIHGIAHVKLCTCVFTTCRLPVYACIHRYTCDMYL